MKTFILASTNKNKIKEFKAILTDINIELMPDIEIEETGATFEENALIKARAIYALTKKPVIADDSGIEVIALGGAPGIYSARYSGGDYRDNNKKLLKEMAGKTDRRAKFVCVIALILEDGSELTVRGETEGEILEVFDESITSFGYDPLFYIKELNLTYASMPSDMKNKISHRAKAINELKKELEKNVR